MGQIFLVRHGQASFGAADYDRLSDLGAAQSRLLGQWFADCGQGFTLAVMGRLLRHRQTAEACLGAMPAGLKPAAEPDIDAGFDEYDHQEVLLRHRPEFATPEGAKKVLTESAQPGDTPRRVFQRVFTTAMARWAGGEHDGDYTESWTGFRVRCNRALQALVESAGSSQNIVVFTSGGPIAVICQGLLGVADKDAALLNSAVVNSSVTRLLYQPGRISLSTLNSYPHLERSGDARNITYR